ncbi:MAG: hypothetical protein AMJ53_04980, partial [Gammaproteobacteria bacterium SG8_11]
TSILWPAPTESSQGTDLWKHTCFELFIAAAGNPAYWEYNFSPSRQWAVYAFEAYRKAIPLRITSIPIINPPELADNRFSLQTRIALESELIDKPLTIGAATVLETTDGRCQYFALKHCGKKPDFHLRESFILAMD